MRIAFCYENVQPARGGCSTYISDLARRLAHDEHSVHLYACQWDSRALPPTLNYHQLPEPRGPRWLRPWLFARSCLEALRQDSPDVSIGFDKTYGQDVLYPQGGLHAASAVCNLNKYKSPAIRCLAGALRRLDLAHWSYSFLERQQYLREPRPLIVVNSEMVRQHFHDFYGVPGEALRVIRSAIDPSRFVESDRLKRRLEWREHWGIAPEENVALFAAMNYRLKGIEPLLHAVQAMPRRERFRLLILGHSRFASWQRLAKRLGIADHVCFGGYCPDMRNGYFAADFLVHPTFYDPCSLVALEALACGLPVITTRANGASELLTQGREGYVVSDPHKHAELAEALTLLCDPARRVACAQAARRAAMHWTFEEHYQQLLRVFREAAERKHAA